jgi:hypothetical protein
MLNQVRAIVQLVKKVADVERVAIGRLILSNTVNRAVVPSVIYGNYCG